MKAIERPFTMSNYIAAWSVHIFTASAAFLGLFSLAKIYQHQYVFALWLMAITVVIDALDGTFARMVHVKTVLPNIDGALLDNIVDFLNYVITPSFFLIVYPGMVPEPVVYWLALAITITSAYQFCQSDAKTPDHFFKGFPCYWNITIFYMFILHSSPVLNTAILVLFCVLIFVPIKYVYPSRLDYLTESPTLKIVMHICSAVYGISTLCLLVFYPERNMICSVLSLGYIVMYFLLSFYRTYKPLSV